MDLDTAMVASPVSASDDNMVGMVPPPRIMEELQMDLSGISMEDRLSNSQIRLLQGDKPAPYEGEPLAATWEVLRSIEGFCKHAVQGGYELFDEEPEKKIPVYPLPEGAVYNTDSDGYLTITEQPNTDDEEPTTRRVLSRSISDMKSRLNILVLKSDQASYMFVAYLHLIILGLWVCWIPDVCHSDNNDAKNTHNYAGLSLHMAKILFLCKYLAGPFATKGAGGRNRRILRETWEKLRADLRDPQSQSRRLLEERLPAICKDLGLLDPHSQASLTYVIAYVEDLTKHQGLPGCLSL